MTTNPSHTSQAPWHAFIEPADLPHEEHLQLHPFQFNPWLRYLEHKLDASNYEARYFLKALPGSYKLWKQDLDLRKQQLDEVDDTGEEQEGDQEKDDDDGGEDEGAAMEVDEDERGRLVRSLFHCYDRALIFMNKVESVACTFTLFMH